MTGARGLRTVGAGLLAACAAIAVVAAQSPAPPPSQAPAKETQGFKFKSGVELINVTATVTDASGRFVPGLRMDDFVVYEDNELQALTHFSADRVPVSLGILLDTSQSMQGEKFDSARTAIDRFLADLSSEDDEFFLMQFSSTPSLLQGWTADRRAVSRAMASAVPRGGTAMYDAIADSLPLTQHARNRKKALVIVSDGNDMTSDTPLTAIHQIIRESEALVYAVGIDCSGASSYRRQDFGAAFEQRGPRPQPFPFPGGRRTWPPPQLPPQIPPGRNSFNRCSDPVDVMALRDLTDDSGGRTEIVREARELDPVTAGIADELSRQYYLGYPSLGKKDGRWHTIRVEAKNKTFRVRARRGYVAS